MGQPITVVEKPSSRPGIVRFEINRPLSGMGHERWSDGDLVEGDRPVDELARRLFAQMDGDMPAGTLPAEWIPAPAAAPAISFQKVTGTIDLKKGDKPVMMEKTKLITASVRWRSGTDYDVYALVWTKDGMQVDVATFGAKGVPAKPNFGKGAVKHLGDVKAAKQASEQTEIVEIRLSPDIVAVVPVAYSAQSNGSGSFLRYKVSLHIDNGAGTQIGVSADNANNDDGVYTCVPGIIRNYPDGVVIEPLELYSRPGSELRPKLRKGPKGDIEVVMDAGPQNDFK